MQKRIGGKAATFIELTRSLPITRAKLLTEHKNGGEYLIKSLNSNEIPIKRYYIVRAVDIYKFDNHGDNIRGWFVLYQLDYGRVKNINRDNFKNKTASPIQFRTIDSK